MTPTAGSAPSSTVDPDANHSTRTEPAHDCPSFPAAGDFAPISADCLVEVLPVGAAGFDATREALKRAIAATVKFEAAHRADATRKNYGYHWGLFEAWCEENGLVALPASPEVIAVYIGHLAITGGRDRDVNGELTGRRAGTVGGHISAIRAVHRDAGYGDPTKHHIVAESSADYVVPKALALTARSR